ncbi:MAG: class I SAM-dependent methyltransferase [Acidimicrobiia bacterium]|nr:class I SAM-dependent methyltransferase [Acidimicrobiia bacterium]
MSELDPLASASFTAELGQVADWRLVLVFDAARSAGVLDALPAEPAEIAERLALSHQGVRAVLDLLAEAGVVRATAGRFERGERAPDAPAAARLAQQAAAIRRWAAAVEPGLRGEEAPKRIRSPERIRDWLASMAIDAEVQAPLVADRLEAAAGDLRGLRALDLGGGHGRYGVELAHRGATVVLQDRAEVLAVVRDAGWLDATGVETFPRDAHETLAAGPFDVVLAIGLLHTMPPGRVSTLLVRLAAVIRPGGHLLVRTRLRGDGARAAVFAVQMLAAGTGGDAHALDDYRRWLDDAGFGPPAVERLDGSALLIARRSG